MTEIKMKGEGPDFSDLEKRGLEFSQNSRWKKCKVDRRFGLHSRNRGV